MILLSDELWLIANDSKGFKNGSKSIIRNNLGLCKRSEIYLNYNFQKHCYGSTGKKNRFGKEVNIKQINDICEWQKKTADSTIWWKGHAQKIKGHLWFEQPLCSYDIYTAFDKNKFLKKSKWSKTVSEGRM